MFSCSSSTLFLGPICDFLDAEGRHGVNLEKNHGPPPFPLWGQVRATGQVASSGSDEAASPSSLVVSSFYRLGVFSKCPYRKNINKACLHSTVLGSVFAISKGSLAALNTADWTTAVQQESLVLISVQKSKESCTARVGVHGGLRDWVGLRSSLFLNIWEAVSLGNALNYISSFLWGSVEMYLLPGLFLPLPDASSVSGWAGLLLWLRIMLGSNRLGRRHECLGEGRLCVPHTCHFWSPQRTVGSLFRPYFV